MAVRLTLRSIFVLVLVTLVCLVAATYAVVVYAIRKSDLVQDANIKLFTAAHLARVLAGADYHDRIGDKTSITKGHFDQLVAHNDALCLSMGLQYVWSLLEFKEQIVFTTATHAVLTNSQSECASFFEVHSNPGAYRHAFETMQPEFTTFHDKWGRGRMALLPAWDRHRRKYLFAASMQLDGYDALLRRTLLESVLISLGIALLFSLLAAGLARWLTQPLQRLTLALERMGKGDPHGELPGTRVQELATVTDAFEGMRQTLRQRMEDLRASEEQFRGLVDNLGAGVALISPQMRVLALNRQMQQWCPGAGIGAAPLCQMAFWHPVRATVCTDCPVTRTLADGTRHEMISEVMKAGARSFYRISASPLKNATGQIVAAIELVEDITERQRVTEALAQSQADLQAILESTPDIIFSLSVADGRLRQFNAAFAREVEQAYGVSAQVGLCAEDILPASALPVWAAMVRRALVQQVYSAEYVRPEDQRCFELNFNLIRHRDQVTGLSVFIREVTARKRAEAALQENEAQLQALFTILPTGISIVDKNRGLVKMNPELLRILGLTEEEMRQGAYSKRRYVRADGSPMPEEEFPSVQAIREKREIRNVEIGIVKEDGSILWSLVSAVPLPENGAALATRDITGHKQAQALLAASEARYRDLFTTMTEGLALHQVIYDEAGQAVDYIVLDVNPAFERLTGFRRENIIGRRATEAYVRAQAPCLAVYAGVAQTLQPFNFEEFFGRPPRHFHITVYAPQPGYFATLLEDVTERRRMTDALRESQAQLTAVLESTQDMIWAVEAKDFALLMFNSAFAAFTQRLFGVKPQQGMTAREVLPPDRLAVWEKLFQKAITSGAYTLEYHVVMADLDLEVTFNPIREHGRVVAIAIFGRDVTARNLVQNALRESQAHLTAVLESTEDLIWSMDARTLEVLAFNTALADDVFCTYGVRLRPGINLREVLPADRIPAFEALMQRAIREGHFTDEFFRANNPKYFERTFNPIVKEGQAVSVSIFARDITERRRAEQALRESEEKFSRMAAHLESVLYSVDATTREFRYVSPAFTRLLGYTLADVQQMGGRRAFLNEVIQGGRFVYQDRQLDTLARQSSGVGAHLEGWWRCKDGTLRYMQDHWMPVYVEGRLVSTEGILTDITQAKLAENKLRESEGNFRAFFESVTDMIIVASMEGHILFTNRAVTHTLGYTPGEIRELHLLDLHPKDRRQEAETIFAAMFKGEQASCPLPVVSKSGRLIPVETRVWQGNWNGVECIFGVCKNLTVEQEAQQRFERLFRNNPALMVLSNLSDRRFYDVNEAFLKTLGFQREEVLGKTASELGLFPNPEQQTTLAEKLLHAGSISDCELQVRRKDGVILDGLFSGEMISNQGQLFFLTVMIDITSRRKLETQLLEVSEREQRRFGHDLHDGIGQQLAALRFLSTALLQKTIQAAPVEPAEVERLDTLMGETLKQVRQVARGLHPVSADPEGLMHGLRELCRQCQPLFGVACAFECPEPVTVREQQAAQNLYRIAQEALRNAATHGAPQQIKVRLQQAGDAVCLEIGDDGKGLRRETKQKRGLGLDIMRYRAHAIGATLDIQSKPGAGVIIRCVWPVGR